MPTTIEVITPSEILQIMPAAGTRAAAFAGPLSEAMAEFDISTARRQAAFLAIVAEESWELQYLLEKSTGAAYEPPSKIADALGNTQPGDGLRFIGRGPGQATGRWMYGALQQALKMPLLSDPAMLEEIVPGCRAAAWIWAVQKKLNPHADGDEFGSCCQRWNGGYNGIDARLKYWLRARHVFGL